MTDEKIKLAGVAAVPTDSMTDEEIKKMVDKWPLPKMPKKGSTHTGYVQGVKYPVTFFEDSINDTTNEDQGYW